MFTILFFFMVRLDLSLFNRAEDVLVPCSFCSYCCTSVFICFLSLPQWPRHGVGLEGGDVLIEPSAWDPTDRVLVGLGYYTPHSHGKKKKNTPCKSVGSVRIWVIAICEGRIPSAAHHGWLREESPVLVWPESLYRGVRVCVCVCFFVSSLVCYSEKPVLYI